MRAERPGSHHPYTAAVIVAAGSGTRMGGTAKPLIPLYKGKTVFEYVLDAFADCPVIDEIIVVCKDKSLFEPLLGGRKAVFSPGGSTRALSVFNGVQKAGAHAEFVCIHDCARPFITSGDISAVCNKAYETSAASGCVNTRDTIKYLEPEHNVLFTPKRENLISVVTPQVFRRDVYLAAYSASLGGAEATDETTICERAGFTVSYVPLDSNTMKLTTAYDVKLAKAVCFLDRSENKRGEADV